MYVLRIRQIVDIVQRNCVLSK